MGDHHGYQPRCFPSRVETQLDQRISRMRSADFQRCGSSDNTNRYWTTVAIAKTDFGLENAPTCCWHRRWHTQLHINNIAAGCG